MTTLRELSMLHLMNSITDEPEWYTKVHYSISIPQTFPLRLFFTGLRFID